MPLNRMRRRRPLSSRTSIVSPSKTLCSVAWKVAANTGVDVAIRMARAIRFNILAIVGCASLHSAFSYFL